MVEVPFSLRDSPSRITVWDVGQIEPACQQPGLRIPVNDRASCQSFPGLGRAAKMETAASPHGAGIACTVTVQDSGERFEGSNPTAATVAAALAHGSNQYMHGVQAFGIANPVAQRKLQQPVPDAATASAEAGRSSTPEAAKQQACSAPASLAPEQQQNGISTAAAEPADAAAAGAAKMSGPPDQPASPSVLVQTAAMPPLQLIKQMQDKPAQPSQQERVVQTGATTATAGPNVGGSTPARGHSPLPPVSGLRLLPQQPAASAAETQAVAPTTPPSAVKMHPQIELFKPSPSRATAASASARDSAAEHPAPQPGSQQHQQGLPHFASFAMPPGLPQNGLPSAQPQPGGAFTPFSAGLQPAPAFLTAPMQLASPTSPFLAARAAAGASCAGAPLHSAQLLQLPQLSVPSWSGSNCSSSSMMSPSVFGSSLGASNGGSGNHTGALEAASVDLRSLSNGSFGSLSSLSRGSWGSLHPGSATIGSSPLLDYFGHLAASRGAAGWDPIAVAALTKSAARLSSNDSTVVRALAEAAAADVAAAGGGGLKACSLTAPAAAAAVVAGKQPSPRLTAAAPTAASAVAAGANQDALEQQPPPRGRLTPEALSKGAAAAEGLLTSQGLLNPSAATVKAPRMAAKGWTAFTAFGLHTRDAVRSANPGATSIEVEKLVGQLWGRLSRDEKQGWVQRAARARSARGAGGGGGSSQAKAKRKRPASEAAPQHDSGVESPSIHRRKRSSRIRRPPAHHDGADTSEGHDVSPKSPQEALAAGDAIGGGVSDSPRAAFGPASGSSRVTANAHAGVSAGIGCSGPSGHGGGGGHIAGVSMPKSQAAADLEMEVGTLEVLASMQAAAADSRRGAFA